MADVSKIKVPNGTVYNLKDETARAGLAGKADASHTHSEYASKSIYGDTAINVGRKADTTVGLSSTAEGYKTTASGSSSHAEGFGTIASGDNSHAEGRHTTASGFSSHAEGLNTTASGQDAHAEGLNTTASGDFSHAGGRYTIALHDCEAAYGTCNKSNADTLFSIGDGSDLNNRHNAFEITTTGGKLHDKDIATMDDIPASLPANGGNADTVGLRNSHDFLGKDYVYPTFVNYGFGSDLNNYVTEYHGFIYNCENSPIAHVFGFLDVSFFDGTGFSPSPPDKGGVVLQKFYRVDNCVFTRMRVTNVWSDWKEISTTPIKKISLPSVATNAGGGGVLFLADFGTPITIACTSRGDTQCTPFYYGDSNQWLLLAKDCTTLAPIPAGSYSFDVWYI